MLKHYTHLSTRVYTLWITSNDHGRKFNVGDDNGTTTNRPSKLGDGYRKPGTIRKETEDQYFSRVYAEMEDQR